MSQFGCVFYRGPSLLICGWPLAERSEDGCVRGNCSQRPLPPRFYDPERADREHGRSVSHHQQPLSGIELENASLWNRIRELEAERDRQRAALSADRRAARAQEEDVVRCATYDQPIPDAGDVRCSDCCAEAVPPPPVLKEPTDKEVMPSVSSEMHLRREHDRLLPGASVEAGVTHPATNTSDVADRVALSALVEEWREQIRELDQLLRQGGSRVEHRRIERDTLQVAADDLAAALGHVPGEPKP